MALRRVLQTEPQLLDQVAEQGWRLPTGELALLLGREELTGDVFECYGYRFTRGDEGDLAISWRVEKVSS
ncbi:hypothetical protein N836_19480 [Leptolyngbya sp. Heron Island J]|uniref:hypothetical protein n=1 Tax=Leptolyngbya sp. Heron Island J TaxID=1385935 RepID=UPI0003B9D0DF|nr:hypothetical protein [Leptolyngbya sp. Heron Island J]ESA33924.1 hypothetical protein N836_19480 [Leptolyngbya sp. Heron Island J]